MVKGPVKNGLPTSPNNPNEFGLISRVKVVSSDLSYYGKSLRNIETNQTGWQIYRERKIDVGSETIKEFVNGDPGYNYIWDDRLTYTYGTETESAFINNQSLQFDGVNEYVTVPSIPFTDQYSISFWFKKDAATTRQALMGKWSNNASEAQFYVVYEADSTIDLILLGNSTFVPFSSSATVTAGAWHHMVITNSSNTVGVWVDGVQIIGPANRSGNVGTSVSSTVPFVFGGRGIANFLYTGLLDEIIIYDVELTTSNITALYNSGLPINPTTLDQLPITWLRMGDELNELTLPDQVGSNDGTLVNMTSANLNSDVPG